MRELRSGVMSPTLCFSVLVAVLAEIFSWGYRVLYEWTRQYYVLVRINWILSTFLLSNTLSTCVWSFSINKFKKLFCALWQRLLGSPQVSTTPHTLPPLLYWGSQSHGHSFTKLAPRKFTFLLREINDRVKLLKLNVVDCNKIKSE